MPEDRKGEQALALLAITRLTSYHTHLISHQPGGAEDCHQSGSGASTHPLLIQLWARACTPNQLHVSTLTVLHLKPTHAQALILLSR